MSWPLALVLCTATISVAALLSKWIDSSCVRRSSARDQDGVTDRGDEIDVEQRYSGWE